MTEARGALATFLILLSFLLLCAPGFCQEQIYNGKREKVIMQIPRAYTTSVPKALKFMEEQFCSSGSRRSGDNYMYIRKVSYVSLKSIEDRMAELIAQMKTNDLFITVDYTCQQIPDRYSSSSSSRRWSDWELQISWIDAADMTSYPERKAYYITSVTSKHIKINAGARDGIKKGDTIEIIKRGSVIGSAKIEEMSNSSSKALITELKERNVSAGASIRLTQTGGIDSELIEKVKADDVCSLKTALLNDSELVKRCDSQGRALLHLAAYYGSSEVTILLIASGADVNARDSQNMTPLQYAEGRGNNEVAEILRSKGAK